MPSGPPQIVHDLVERFQRNLQSYQSPDFNEANLRIQFINPFFEALGWDVTNRTGKAEAYKDVIHEDAIKVGGTTKAPDYCFRIGGTRKFFLEAKKPAVNLKDEISPAYQLRRYAWSAKLPLSILTDFEEFAVYDCRTRPSLSDKPATSRTLYLTYKDYLEKWDEIASIFSKEAVEKGSFDRYAVTDRKRGTATVDAEFLAEIEHWRESLAKNLALRNPRLSVHDLNFAVQRTIDRIIFLRICEDRGVEHDGQLQALLNGEHTYGRLRELYTRADDRYNSGLFHFQAEKGRAEAPDNITPSLKIDDKVLKEIIKRLYYPDSPYEFSVFPAEILGQVYEQFLGKVIRLTAGHQAKVEEKPEVKKAGGVYYTPTYVVEYIVQQTVGKFCRNKTPRHIERFRVLDPACGSGSFLISAYGYLMKCHRDWYLQDGPEKHKKELFHTVSGEWRLTTQEKKRILLNNIYGVDIDNQAVEVTKLSLLLKVLEGESDETLKRQLSFVRERALPDLGNNIKCGNSLIGTDYFSEQLLPDDEEMHRVNPFDWESEFSQIIKTGGFDAVIGNPPWGGDIDKQLSYLHAKYPESTQEHTDSFKLFIEGGLRLTRDKGVLSMIAPNTLLRQRRIRDVRSLMLQNQIIALVDLGEEVFDRVVAPSCIFVIEKAPCGRAHKVQTLNLGKLTNAEKAAYFEKNGHAGMLVEQSTFSDNADLEFAATTKRFRVPVIALGKLKDFECKDAGINYQRVRVGMQEKGKSDLSERLLYEGNRRKASDQMYWKGSDIDRYRIAESTTRFCRTNYKGFIRPNEVVHLGENIYKVTPKILLRQTADHIIAVLDQKGVWFGRSIIAIVPSISTKYRTEYLLGLLNSKYLCSLYHELAHETGRVFAQVKLAKLKQLPIRSINFSNPQEKSKHDKMVALVERMMGLHQRLAKTKGEADKLPLHRQIHATDREIDRLVYDLYELTEEEISI